MKVLLYWLARTGMFLSAVVILAAVGWWDIFSLLAALVLAWLVSYLALPDMRRRAAEELDGWIEQFQSRHRRDDAAEDAEAADLQRNTRGQQ